MLKNSLRPYFKGGDEVTKKRTITELERLRDTVRDDFRLGFVKPKIAHKLLKSYDKKIEEVRSGKA